MPPMEKILINDTIGEDADGRFLRETWLVKNAPSQEAALAFLPKRGAKHETVPNMFLDGKEAGSVPESVDYYHGELTYRTPQYTPATPPGALPAEGAKRPRTASPVAVVKAWRIEHGGQSLSFPAGGDDPDQAKDTGDVGGFPIDDRGEPIDRPLKQQQLAFRFAVRAPVSRAMIYGYHLTRNASPFLGYPTGSVLLLDPQINPIDEETDEVLLTFLYDPWLHLRQKTFFSSEGDVLVWGADEAGVEASHVGRAKYIVWYQPFPAKKNHQSLLNSLSRLTW